MPKLAIRCGFGIGKIDAIEMFNPLFSIAPMEVVNCDDVENIEVIFASINLFIPSHRGFERLHPKGALSSSPGLTQMFSNIFA